MTKKFIISNEKRRSNTPEIGVLDLIQTSARTNKKLNLAKDAELIRLRRELVRSRKSNARLVLQRDEVIRKLKIARALIRENKKSEVTTS